MASVVALDELGCVVALLAVCSVDLLFFPPLNVADLVGDLFGWRVETLEVSAAGIGFRLPRLGRRFLGHVTAVGWAELYVKIIDVRTGEACMDRK